MAQISPGRQYEQKEYTVGCAKGTTWHTPVSVGSNILQFVESIGFAITGPQRLPDKAIGRKLANYNPAQGKIDIKGDLPFSALTYGQITSLFACCFGSDTVTGSAGAGYTHTLAIEPTLWGKFLTLAYLFVGDAAVEFPSVKFHSFEMNIAPGDVAKGKFSGLADYGLMQVDSTRAGSVVATDKWTPTVSAVWQTNQWIGFYVVVTASGTPSEVGKSFPITANTDTYCTATGMTAGAPGATSAYIGPKNAAGAGGTFGTTASVDFGARLHYDDMLVRIGVPGLVALDSDDDFNIGNFKFTFDRPMVGDHRSASTGANILSKHAIFEPRDTDQCKCDLELQFPNVDAQVLYLLQQWMNTSPQSVRIEVVFTSSVTISGTSPAVPYSFSLIIPGSFMEGNPVVMPANGGVPATLKFMGTYYTSGGTDTAPYVTIVNGESGAAI